MIDEKTVRPLTSQYNTGKNIIPDFERRKNPDPVFPGTKRVDGHFDVLYLELGMFFLKSSKLVTYGQTTWSEDRFVELYFHMNSCRCSVYNYHIEACKA